MQDIKKMYDDLAAAVAEHDENPVRGSMARFLRALPLLSGDELAMALGAAVVVVNTSARMQSTAFWPNEVAYIQNMAVDVITAACAKAGV